MPQMSFAGASRRHIGSIGGLTMLRKTLKAIEGQELKDSILTMAASNIVYLTETNFPEEVTNSPTPVLVDFWAEWCGPCKMIAPLLDELALEYDGKVKVAKVNIDEQQNLASQHGIRAVPTLLIFKGGEVAEQIVGVKSKRDLKASLDKVSS